MKRKILFFYLLILFVVACEKLPDPSIDVLEGYSFSNQGSGQKTVAGNYLDDTIGVIIRSTSTSSYDVTRMKVTFEVLTGGGSVDDTVIYTNGYGYAFTKWKSGNQQFTQTVQAKIYNRAGKFLGAINFSANAFIDNAWNQVTDYPDVNILSMVSDTFHKLTLMTSGFIMYKQKNNYFEWEQVNPGFLNPSQMWICNDGTIYALALNNALFKSNDQGNDWDKCNTQFNVNNSQVVVTPEKYIWATWNNSGLRCSRDGGLNWTIDSVGLPPDEGLGDICHMSNGTWIILTQSRHSYKSLDDGKTWTKVYCPAFSLKLFVTPNDEIIYCNQENGISIYKSTDLGESFKKAYGVYTTFVSTLGQTFYHYQGTWYLLIQGFGILSTKDFSIFQPVWYNSNARDMFVDGNGVFIVEDVNWQSVYYHRGAPSLMK
jgi:hypothetical protein